MRRAVVAGIAGATASAAALLAGPAYATDGVQHLAFSFDEDPVRTQIDEIGPGCPSFSGLLEEDRHLEVAGIMREDGSGHARTVVTARVALEPEETGAVSYTGGYTQHQSGFFVDDGHGDRVVTTTMQGSITGSDGSSWHVREVVHVSVDGSGTVRAWFDRMRCS